MKELPKPILVKLGGNEAEDEAFLNSFAAALRKIPGPKIVVHGGGKTLSQLQERLGLKPVFIDGQRFTDLETLAVAEMSLCGTANKRLVRALLKTGLLPLGISGMDAGLVICNAADPILGRVGIPTRVNAKALTALLDAGFTPVIAPIGLNEKNEPLNVNADLVAGAIAGAMQASQLIFLSNVPGVLVGGRIVETLSEEQVQNAIAAGQISGGMIPKVNAALTAAKTGLLVRICNLEGLLAGGTTIYDVQNDDESGVSGSDRADCARSQLHSSNL